MHRISGGCYVLVSVGEAPNSLFLHTESNERSGGPFEETILIPPHPVKPILIIGSSSARRSHTSGMHFRLYKQ